LPVYTLTSFIEYEDFYEACSERVL